MALDPAARDAFRGLPAPASDALLFWFGEPDGAEWGSDRPEWFRKNAAFDEQVRARFGSLIERALAGALDDWPAPWGALAAILVLDQFTRNAFRGTARCFAGDARALALADALLATREDLGLPPVHRAFVYMPLEHAEDLDAQHRSVRLFSELAAARPASQSALDYAQRHRDVIARFGRFPHRNAMLGRRSTPEETAFLEIPGARF